MKKLKVYRWHTHNPECPPAHNRSRSCEHKISPYFLKTYGGITGNAESIRVALSNPGTPGPKEWKRQSPRP